MKTSEKELRKAAEVQGWDCTIYSDKVLLHHRDTKEEITEEITCWGSNKLKKAMAFLWERYLLKHKEDK